VKGTPLGKLLRQLRIDRDEFALCEQKQSRIAFGLRGELSLRFTNDFAVLESEIAAKFPAQIDGFRQLVGRVRAYADVALDTPYVSARAAVREHLTDPLLEAMLFCPIMYYGSAEERDMDFGQFVIMFKALFLEGFARPLDGVRVILRVLLEKFRTAGGERRMKCGVRKIVVRDGRASALVLDDGGEITAAHVLSSAGAPETMALIADSEFKVPSSAEAVIRPEVGRLSFCETITILDRAPAALGWGDDTIVFFNDSPRFTYAAPPPDHLVDTSSGVICIPNNFAYPAGESLPEGVFRVTCLARHDLWARLPEATYREAKRVWYDAIQTSARRFLPPLATDDALRAATLATDMFTPRTITKFTGHFGGAIYGSPQKIRDGRTPLANLYLCGTDQGFLGIVGAMLSGISMANLHILAAKS
jgi:phytoene dehydrogenase-like protein